MKIELVRERDLNTRNGLTRPNLSIDWLLLVKYECKHVFTQIRLMFTQTHRLWKEISNNDICSWKCQRTPCHRLPHQWHLLHDHLNHSHVSSCTRDVQSCTRMLIRHCPHSSPRNRHSLTLQVKHHTLPATQVNPRWSTLQPSALLTSLRSS